MDTSKNKDIAMRQNLLSVAGKNTIPPQHIVEQQQRLSETQLASQSTKIIPLEHRELCPLCHCPSFIFVQSKYSKNGLHHTSYSSPLPLHCGTFSCSKCSNNEIKMKLNEINQLRHEIAQKSQRIEPILRQKVDAPNTQYHDKRFKIEQIKQRIKNLRRCIQQTYKENKLLKTTSDKLHIENKQRLSHLQRFQTKLNNQWKSVLLEKRQQYELEQKRASINTNICTQISLTKLLQISDFYAMKVLPTMHMKGNEARQLSMIQNIAVPSVFKTKNISSFYSDEKNELFRFPVPKTSQNLHINIPTSPNYPYFNRSSSSLLNYKSSKYRVALKKTVNKGSGSPLQKYMPRLTNSISSISEKMGIPILTPPAYRQRDTISGKESKSLPKNLDDLILPPTFFSDDEADKNEKGEAHKEKERRKSAEKQQHKKKEVNKISGRGRSHSFDALPVHNEHCRSQLLLHEPHMEHGICAALQYIVSFVLRAAKYLNVELLYKMGLYRKSKRGQFIMHTYIENKGKYFRLYWIEKRDYDFNVMETNEEQKEKTDLLHKSEGNILEFQHGLHLLQENINHLSVKCGVKSSRLYYFQLIANLNTLISHLKVQSKKYSDGDTTGQQTKNERKHRIHRMHVKKPQIEPMNIINDYQSSNNLSTDNVHLGSTSREHSKSHDSHSNSASHSELLLSPPADSEGDDWDFVDYN